MAGSHYTSRPEELKKRWTDAEAPIFQPPDATSWLSQKDPDAGKDWGQKEKGMTEDVMVGWYHCLNGREFEQTRETAKNIEAWYAAVHGVRHDLATE